MPEVPSAAPGEPRPLSPVQLQRYSRHLLLPEIGLSGQQKLANGRVLLVGAGGLGAPAALYLAAAGVGEIGIVEHDRVDLSNLQRQVLYTTDDIGLPKRERAEARLRALNPDLTIRTWPEPLRAANALERIAPYDVVVDGSDNFPTRYLVNDACVLLHKPNVFGSVYRFEGQASVFDPPHGPCYRCLFPEPPPPAFVPSCAEGGVLGVVPGLIGEIQATEALKLLLGVGESLSGRLLLFDALEMRFRELRVDRTVDCAACGDAPTIHALIDYAAFCGVAAPGDAEVDAGVPRVSPAELAAELDRSDPPLLLDVRQPGEWALGHLRGARLIPEAEVADHLEELAPAPRIVVYCSHGVRSTRAARELLDLGLTGVRALAGGLEAWAAQDLPVEGPT